MHLIPFQFRDHVNSALKDKLTSHLLSHPSVPHSYWEIGQVTGTATATRTTVDLKPLVWELWSEQKTTFIRNKWKPISFFSFFFFLKKRKKLKLISESHITFHSVDAQYSSIHLQQTLYPDQDWNGHGVYPRNTAHKARWHASLLLGIPHIFTHLFTLSDNLKFRVLNLESAWNWSNGKINK